MVNFGEKLRALRTRANLSQDQLACRLAVTKGMISSYETGMRMPSYVVLEKIARIFNVSTDYLLGLDNSEFVDISGLSEQQKRIILDLINEFKNIEKIHK